MSIKVAHVAVAAITMIGAAQVSAQTLKNGGPKGIVQSASTSIGASTTSPVFFTTPAEGFFILTDFCRGSQTNGVVTLAGSSMGSLMSDVDGGCISLSSGIALPPNESLTCINQGSFAGFCSISGVLSKK